MNPLGIGGKAEWEANHLEGRPGAVCEYRERQIREIQSEMDDLPGYVPAPLSILLNTQKGKVSLSNKAEWASLQITYKLSSSDKDFVHEGRLEDSLKLLPGEQLPGHRSQMDGVKNMLQTTQCTTKTLQVPWPFNLQMGKTLTHQSRFKFLNTNLLPSK